jgi:hypothetical protein
MSSLCFIVFPNCSHLYAIGTVYFSPFPSVDNSKSPYTFARTRVPKVKAFFLLQEESLHGARLNHGGELAVSELEVGLSSHVVCVVSKIGRSSGDVESEKLDAELVVVVSAVDDGLDEG